MNENHGVERLVAEAREAALTGIDPSLAQFLPEVSLHFANLVV